MVEVFFNFLFFFLDIPEQLQLKKKVNLTDCQSPDLFNPKHKKSKTSVHIFQVTLHGLSCAAS